MMKTEKMYFSHEENDDNDKIEHIQQIDWKIWPHLSKWWLNENKVKGVPSVSVGMEIYHYGVDLKNNISNRYIIRLYRIQSYN